MVFILIFIFLIFIFLIKKEIFFFYNIYINFFFLFIYNNLKDFLVIIKKNSLLNFFFTFIIILVCNIVGIFPYSFALTSHIYLTFFISLSFFYGLFIISLRFKNIFFFSYFYISGVPIWLIPILVIIEIFSFFGRLVSLPVRLFANIMAGHMLIKILSQFAWLLFFSSFYFSYLFILFFILFFVIIGIFFLELAISFIQAYIFVTLQSIYLGEILV